MIRSDEFFDDWCIVNIFLACLMVSSFLDIRGHTFDSVGFDGLGIVDDRWGLVGV